MDLHGRRSERPVPGRVRPGDRDRFRCGVFPPEAARVVIPHTAGTSGNDVPAGVDRGDCSAYVADALRTLGEFAEPAGIDVLLEMHGEFNYWGLARDTMRLADHPRVGLIYNSDPRDIAAGSVAATYSQVRQWIRHVHIAEFSGRYPYAELFDLLKADRYDRYLAAEISKEVPPPEEYLATYSALFRAWAGQPFFPIGD